MNFWYSWVQTIYFLNFCSVVSNPDVEMEVTHEEEKVKDSPLVSELLFTTFFIEGLSTSVKKSKPNLKIRLVSNLKPK